MSSNEFLTSTAHLLQGQRPKTNTSVSPEGIRTLSSILQAATGVGLDNYPSVANPLNDLDKRSQTPIPNFIWHNGAWVVKGCSLPSELQIKDLVGRLGGDTGDSMPSQAYLDAWVQKNSFNILDVHGPVEPSNTFLLSNIIAIDLLWDTPFNIVPMQYLPKSSDLAFWEKDALLQAVVDEPTLYLYQDKVFGVLKKTSQAGNGQFVVTSIIAHALTVTEAAEVLLNGEARPLTLEEITEQIPQPFYTWDKVQSLSPTPRTTVNHPAWSSIDTHQITADTFQQVVVKYDAVGFKAAALTMMVGRAVARSYETIHTTLNFQHPFFVFAQYEEEGSVWDKEVLFMSKVNVASDA